MLSASDAETAAANERRLRAAIGDYNYPAGTFAQGNSNDGNILPADKVLRSDLLFPAPTDH